MIVNDPEVTLEWDGHGLPDDAREDAFLDWLCSSVAHGDDGKTYWFGCSPLVLALEKTDLFHYEVCWETGKVAELPGSMFKVADFPPVDVTGQAVYPPLTPHSHAYGYNWSGTVEGVLTIQGRRVPFKGKGIRERYVAVDSSAAEIGGWEDWMWFHFDEAFGSLYEMKLGQKDMSLNLADEQLYLPAGDFTIEHHEWAFLRPLGGFIPTRYKVTMETDAGVLEFFAGVVGATVWGVTGKAPSTPVATLNWGQLEGTFTYTDGRKRTLTNGLGGVSIRQWKPYPDVFGAQLGTAEPLHAMAQLSTL